MSKSHNKIHLSLRQRIKISADNRKKVQRYMKRNDLSFLREILSLSDKLKDKDMTYMDKMLSYMFFEGCITMRRLANDICIEMDTLHTYKYDLLKKLSIS